MLDELQNKKRRILAPTTVKRMCAIVEFFTNLKLREKTTSHRKSLYITYHYKLTENGIRLFFCVKLIFFICKINFFLNFYV